MCGAMHYGLVTASRSSFSCFRGTKKTVDVGLRQRFSYFTNFARCSLQRANKCLPESSSCPRRLRRRHLNTSLQPFSSSHDPQSQPSPPPEAPIPERAPSQLPFRDKALSPHEVTAIFGTHGPSPRLANVLLKVLHSRRVNGSLDLDLPPKLIAQLKRHPHVVDEALKWLRRHYPIDEDAAIIRRIEREDAGHGNEELINRAENLGLYKPQSGSYGAELGEEGDIFGQSILQKLKEKNELKAEKEKEELDEYIQHRQKVTEEKSRALEAKKENGLEVSTGSRPPNAFERWKLQLYLGATSKISLEEMARMGKLRRLLPSLLFASGVTLACYLYAETWTSPDRSSRLMPSQPLSRATTVGIVGVNLLILVLWRFPPAWRLLNRYFISTPGEPRSLSHLGNVFSHQTLSHLVINMALLYLFGEKLHEQIGRGPFLALYIASGVGGSVISMTSFVLRNILVSSALGASGAISGIMAAVCVINPEAKVTTWLLTPWLADKLPWDLTNWLSCEASTFLIILVAYEVLFMSVPFLRSATTDYVAHLGGYAVGALGGLVWAREHRGGRADLSGQRHSAETAKWYDKVLGMTP